MSDLITATQLQNMLKDYYQETQQDAPMEVAVKMWDEIYKNTSDVDGIAVKAIAKVRRNLGIQTSAFTDSNEPSSGNRGYERATIQPRFIKAKGLFDQQLALMSKTDTGAFVKELVAITEDLDESVRLNLARQVFGDGSGKLAELTADVSLGAGVTIYVHTTQYLEVGMPIAIYNAAGTYVEATTIDAVDPEGNNITADITNNIQSLYYLTLGESASITSKDTEFTGLNSAIAKDNTYFGISRANFPVWRGSVLGVGSGVANRPARIAEANIAKTINGIMKRSRKIDADGNMSAYDFVLTDFEAYTKYWTSLTGDRRYMDNAEYKTGVTGLLIDQKKVERDAYCIKEHASAARITSYGAGAPATFGTASTGGLVAGDKLEIYRGETLIGHISAVTNIVVDTSFDGTFAGSGTPASGDLVYLDNEDAGTTDNTASRVFHNMYFINRDTWEWFIWQDITNYTEQLIGLEFVKVAGKTQYEFTLSGLMELFTATPTKNGRYRFTIDPAFDQALSM